ncbi:MAG: cache domain-containing protein [Spirochaetaceae bacterium]|jgi:two-component system sensor histidine kinase YesM|nr:cache domain-containing protein [Spirochaetaceae bacterium]
MFKNLLNTRSSIQKKIFLYFLLFSFFLSLSFLFIVYGNFLKTYIDSEKDNALRSANKTKQNIEFLLNMTENTASLLATSEPLLEALASNDSVNNSNYDLQKVEQDRMLKSIISVHEFIDNIYILGTDGEFFSSYWGSDHTNIEARFLVLIKKLKTRQEYINGEPIISYQPFFDLNIISFTRPVFLYPENKGLGLIIIEMNYTYLREMFTHSSLQEGEEKILVMNKSGETLFTYPFNTSLTSVVEEYPELLEANGEIQGKVFGKDSFIVSSNISSSDWVMIRILSKHKIYSTIYNLIKIGLILWLLVIVFAFLVSFLLSVSITNPIIKLHDTILKIEKWDLKIRASG